MEKNPVSRIYEDPEIGEIVFRKSRRCGRMSIRVHPVRGVAVSLPYLTPYASGLKFFMEKRDWVLAALERQKKASGDIVSLTPQETERLRAEARAWLPGRTSSLAEEYGFVYNSLSLKNNRSNWGSCSMRGNINLNIKLMLLPEPLRDYVILHELCHLRHHDHGRRFHELLERLCVHRLGTLAALHSAPSASGACAPVSGPAVRTDEIRACLAKLQSEISACRAAYPATHVMRRMMRRYRIS